MNLENAFEISFGASPLLPKEYQQVEYIESTSSVQRSNYINTHVSLVRGFSFEIKFKAKYNPNSAVFGYNSDTFGALFGTGTDRIPSLIVHLGTAVYYYNIDNINEEIEYTIKYDKLDLYINNQLVHTFREYKDRSNFYLFGYVLTTTSILDAKAKLYYCKVWDASGVLTNELIPCYRKSDGEIGVYDVLGQTFMTNSGTVPFVKGNDIPTVKHIAKDGTVLWQRAVEKTTEKGGNVSFNNTRYAGDGESYPAFPHTQVLPSVKAYGKIIEAKPQEELWGRYVPVEYIENSGTQYIKTGFVTADVDEVDLSVATTDTTLSSQYFIGTRDTGDTAIGYALYFTTHSGLVSYPLTWAVSGYSMTQNQIYNIQSEFKNGTHTFTVEGKTPLTSTYNQTKYADGGYIRIGCCTNKYETGSQYISSARYYRVAFKKSDIVIADFIPVKDTITNKYGLFDRVENKFYGNSGTGDFTAGDEIKQIEYLQSTGTQYIDTGIKPSNNTKIKAIMSETSAGKFFFGERSTSGSTDGFALYSSNDTWYPFFSSAKSTVGTITPNKKYNIELSKDGLVVDGTLLQGPYSDTFTSDYSIYLFGLNQGGTVETRKLVGTVGDTSIYDNNILVRDFIPVKIGTTGYMLDLVEWKLYANAGTEDFICGNEIPNTMLVPNELYGNKGKIEVTKWNQLIKNGNFANGVTDWGTDTKTTQVVNGNYVTVTTEMRYGRPLNQPVSFISGHLYLISFEYQVISGSNFRVYIGYLGAANHTLQLSSTQLIRANYILRPTETNSNTLGFSFFDEGGGEFKVGNVMVIDLTAIFGLGTEPSASIAKLLSMGIDINKYQEYTTGTCRLYGVDNHIVTLEGKNLFDISGSFSSGYFDKNGNPQGGTNNIKTNFYIEISKNTDYILSVNTNIYGLGVVKYDADKNFIKREYVSNGNVVQFNSLECKYIKIFFNKDQTTVMTKELLTQLQPQLEKGSIATPYAPYIVSISKQIQDLLYSANSYKDLQTGSLYQDWGIIVLDGTESWSGDDYSTYKRYYLRVDNLLNTDPRAVQGYCNYFRCLYRGETLAEAEAGDFYFAYSIIYMHTEIPTLTDWKAYLAEQYANGTPVIVIYPLATPTTTAGTADAYILTTKGNKTLSTDVAGTGVQATYLGE